MSSAITTGIEIIIGAKVADTFFSFFDSVTKSIENLIKSSTNFALMFGQDMRNVNSIAHTTEEQFKSMNNELRQLTEDPNIKSGPRDLAQGMYQLQSSGFDVAQSMKIAQIASLDASAGMSKTSVAVESLASIMNAYSDKTIQFAEKMSDQLFKTVEKGVVTFDQLSSAMGRILPVMSSNKVATEDWLGAYVELTKAGQSARIAQVGMIAVANQFQKPTKEAMKITKEYGFEMNMTTLASKGLAGSLQELWERVGKNKEVMGKIFGQQEQQRAIFTLLKNDMKDYIQSVNDVKNSTGSASRAAEEQMKSTQNQIEKLSSSIENMLIGFGDRFVEILAPFVKLALDVVNYINKMDEATKDSIVNFVKWTAIIVGGGVALVTLLGIINGIIFVFSSFGAVILTVTSGLGLLFVTIKSLYVVFDHLHVALTSLKDVNLGVLNDFKGWLDYIDPLNILVNKFNDLKNAMKDIGVFTQAQKQQDDIKKEFKEAVTTIQTLEKKVKEVRTLEKELKADGKTYNSFLDVQEDVKAKEKLKEPLFLQELKNQKILNGGLMATKEQEKAITDRVNQRVGLTRELLALNEKIKSVGNISSKEYLELSNAHIITGQASSVKSVKEYAQKQAMEYRQASHIREIEEGKEKTKEIDDSEKARALLKEKELLKTQGLRLEELDYNIRIDKATEFNKILLKLERDRILEKRKLDEQFPPDSEGSIKRKKDAEIKINQHYDNLISQAKKDFYEKEKREQDKAFKQSESKTIKDYELKLKENKTKMSELEKKLERGFLSTEEFNKQYDPLATQRLGLFNSLTKDKVVKVNGKNYGLDPEQKDKFRIEEEKFINEMENRKFLTKQESAEKIFKLNQSWLEKDQVAFDNANELLEKSELDKFIFTQQQLEKEKIINLDFLKFLPKESQKAKDLIKRNSDIDIQIKFNVDKRSVNLSKEAIQEQKQNLDRFILETQNMSLNGTPQDTINKRELFQSKERINILKSEQEFKINNFIEWDKIQQQINQEEFNQEIKKRQIEKTLFEQKITDLKGIADDSEKLYQQDKISQEDLYQRKQWVRIQELMMLKEQKVSSDELFKHKKDIADKEDEIEKGKIDQQKITNSERNAILKGISDSLGLLDSKLGAFSNKVVGVGQSLVKAFSTSGSDIKSDIDAIVGVLGLIVDIFNINELSARKHIDFLKTYRQEINQMDSDLASLESQIENTLEKKLKAFDEKSKSDLQAFQDSIDKKIQDKKDLLKNITGINLENIIGAAFNSENWAKNMLDQKAKTEAEILTIKENSDKQLADKNMLNSRERLKVEHDFKNKMEKLDIDNIANEMDRRKAQLDFDKKLLKEQLDNKDITFEEYQKNIRNKDTEYNNFKISKDNELNKLKIQLIDNQTQRLMASYNEEMRILDEQYKLKIVKEEEYQTKRSILIKDHQKELLDQVNSLASEKDKLTQDLLDSMIKPIEDKSNLAIENINLKMKPIQDQISAIDLQLNEIDRRYNKLQETANKDASNAFSSQRDQRKFDISKSRTNFFGVSEKGFEIDKKAKQDEIDMQFLQGQITEQEKIAKMKNLAVDTNIFYGKIASDIKASQGTTELYYEYVRKGNDAYKEFNALFKDDITARSTAEKKILETKKIALETESEGYQKNINDIQSAMSKTVSEITKMFKDSSGNFSDSLIKNITGTSGAIDIIRRNFALVDKDFSSSAINLKNSLIDSMTGQNGAFTTLKTQLTALKVDLNSTLSQAKSDFASTGKTIDYNQATKTYVSPNTTTYQQQSSQVLNSIANQKKQTESVDEYIARITKEDALAEKNRIASLTQAKSTTQSYTAPTSSYSTPSTQTPSNTVIKGTADFSNSTPTKTNTNFATGSMTNASTVGMFDKGGSLGWINPLNWFESGGIVGKNGKEIIGVGEKEVEVILNQSHISNANRLLDRLENNNKNSYNSSSIYQPISVIITGNSISSAIDLNNISSKVLSDLKSELTGNYR